MYIDIANEKLNKLRERNDFLILSIESSCDETACAVTRGRDVLSNIIASQIEIHKRFGGVVPEIASRNHTLAIKNVVNEALEEAKVTLNDIDVFAVTYGAGLLGALLIGVSFAKALAFSLNKPLIAVNHIHGHISANYIMHKDLEPPYLCLVASGGHTAIVKVKDYNNLEIIGSTQDDACGEAFDKVARVLDLPYPGGPMIENLAKEGKNIIPMPRPYKNQKHFNFSYSGLKTSVINYIHNAEQRKEIINKADIAASFQSAALDMLVENTIRACKTYKYNKIAIAGGVGANNYLRESMDKAGNANNIKVYYPSLKLCTDNAAMIGSCAFYMIKGGAKSATMELDADASLKIDD